MTRVLTAVIAIPIVLLIVLFAPDWIFALAVGLVAATAAEEFSHWVRHTVLAGPASGFWFRPDLWRPLL